MNKFKKNFDNDNYQNGLRVVLICVLAVALVVSINMFVGLIPTKIANIDISTDRVFSIGSDTEESLKALDKPVELIYVCEKGEENHNTQVMLDLYADATDKITARQVDPAFEPQEIIRYTGETSLDNNSVIVVSDGRQQIVNYSDYYSGSSFVLEDYLNSAIKYVTSDELYVAYFTKGHGEMELDKSTISYLGLDGFDYREIDLMEEGKVPEDCKVLVINGIKYDIRAKESEIIKDYVKSGGSVVVTTDHGSLGNLFWIMDSQGLIKDGLGIIMESDPNRYVNDNPAFTVPFLYTDNKILSDGVNYMILPNLTPISVSWDDLDPSVKVTKLLETSENSYSAYSNVLTGETETSPGPFTVGALFEYGENGSEGRIIWISSRYLSDSGISEAAGGGNITFFLNCISYLGKNEPVASIHGKTISTQFLNLTTQQVKIWEIIIPIAVPAAALLIGVIVVLRRKRR